MDRGLSNTGLIDLITPGMVSDLKQICPRGVETDVSLADLSRWKIGGTAKVLLKPATQEQVVETRKYFANRNLPHVVIGMTTNLLFDDCGLSVPCIQIGSQLGRCSYVSENECFDVEAGVWVPGFSRKVMLHGFTGAEHICGIPGTIGGLICMNGGSQRKSIGDSVVDVRSVDKNGAIVTRKGGDCEFEYRNSVYQSVDEIVLSARLRFSRSESKSETRRTMLSILSGRRQKFPQKYPNCGSVFKSNPAMYDVVGPPGRVIESLGYKGKRIGGALVSDRHANFIVNTGGARAEDVLVMISEIYASVYRSTGYKMAIEAKFVTSMGKVLEIDTMITTDR